MVHKEINNMKIHTKKENKDKIIKMIEELELSYKIEERKYRDNIMEEFNWYDLPKFEWDMNMSNNIVIVVKLPNSKREEFFKIFNIKQTKRNYIHYDKYDKDYKDYHYKITETINPKYPVYVLSKGRYQKTYTADTLREMNVPFKIVIEKEEKELYLKCPSGSIKEENILVLPDEHLKYQREVLKYGGGIPSRNFIWEHSKKNGHKKHWIIDDNIDDFYRWDLNVQKKVKSGIVFKIMEDYSDRYSNIGLSGPSYHYSIPAIDTGRRMIIGNSRCYSCILVNHELLDNILDGVRWRGRYNEDSDLTLRVLDKGYCTFLFNNYLSGKKTSGTMKGGNTTTIYDGGSHKGYQDKFNELKENWKHTNYVKFSNKKHVDGRPHHHINYTKLFKQKPTLKKEIDIESLKKLGCNEYNMIFEKEVKEEVKEVKKEEVKEINKGDDKVKKEEINKEDENINKLNKLKVKELKNICKNNKLKKYSKMKKNDLITLLMKLNITV